MSCHETSLPLKKEFINEENNNKYFPVIRVAPLASDIKYQQKFDILLKKDIDATGIDKTCMIQMHLEQPMLKKDLFENNKYIKA